MTSRMTNPGVDRHHISVVSIANFRAYFSEEWPEICIEHSIRDEEYETFYDWTVNYYFSKYLTRHEVELSGTYRHEIYEMASAVFAPYLWSFFLSHFDNNKINFKLAAAVKTLVAGDLLTIAIGINPHV